MKFLYLLPLILSLLLTTSELQAKTYAETYAETSDKELISLANNGDKTASMVIGTRYHNQGKIKQAVKWFTKAAKQGDATAQHIIGLMYSIGEGVKQDKTQAVKWFTKAAKQGDSKAQNKLGVMYLKGEGVKQDKTQAVKWFTKAAKQGDSTAQYNLGVMYSNGEGVNVEKDAEKSMYWFLKAANKGNASGQFEVAKRYVLKDDIVNSIKWFKTYIKNPEATKDKKELAREILSELESPEELGNISDKKPKIYQENAKENKDFKHTKKPKNDLKNNSKLNTVSSKIDLPTVEARPLNKFETLKTWSPLSVTSKNKTFIVISNEALVTENIYSAMLLFGVCGAVWSNDSDVLEGATEIHILNSYKRQGYVFEGGAQECKELGSLKGKEADFFMLGHTHLYTQAGKRKNITVRIEKVDKSLPENDLKDNSKLKFTKYATVFDPVSNIRISPNGQVLCKVKIVKKIDIKKYNDDWYSTNECGDLGVGVIHKSQIWHIKYRKQDK